MKLNLLNTPVAVWFKGVPEAISVLCLRLCYYPFQALPAHFHA